MSKKHKGQVIKYNCKSILIATPCMSHVPVDFLSSYICLDPTPGGRISLKSGALVDKARNDLADQAVKDGIDYICWIDSDMVFQPDLVWKLLADAEAGKDYVTGIAFTRKLPTQPIIYREILWERRDDGGVKCGAHTYHDYPQNQLFKVAGSGLGACIMKTDIVKAVSNEFKCAPFTMLQGLGEDISFNWRLSQMGVDMWCDSRIKVGHVGWVVFGEELYLGQRANEVNND